MNFSEEIALFENTKQIYESARLTFHGTDGFDIYNPSVPFSVNGEQYIFGRIEKREEWSRSWVRLFKNSAKDEWTLVPNSMIYQLEDPFIQIINGEYVLGGTHVVYSQGELSTYYCYFYRGTDIFDLRYFTTGPNFMKDIRLIELRNGKIGVFSRPRNEEVRAKYGSESVVGFTIVNDLNEINDKVLENAEIIDGLFGKDEWGGCNQCYLLENEKIGVIGHKCRKDGENLVYVNISFVFDYQKNKLTDLKIIGTRSCYPDNAAKLPTLKNCAFTSGIVRRADSKVDLYSGIGDTAAARITIDYPF